VRRDRDDVVADLVETPLCASTSAARVSRAFFGVEPLGLRAQGPTAPGQRTLWEGSSLPQSETRRHFRQQHRLATERLSEPERTLILAILATVVVTPDLLK